MNIPSNITPSHALVNGQFFGQDYHGRYIGKLVTLVRDSTGDQYAILEFADLVGIYALHLGSNFFLGWTNE